MVWVSAPYCPAVEQVCEQWADPPGPYRQYRCSRFGPSVCRSEASEQRCFCIDRDEYTRPGERVPSTRVTWREAQQRCEAVGKRLCRESEWQLACEGEQMWPYPFGPTRDKKGDCNIDRQDLAPCGVLRDLREPVGSHSACESPFGVRDMCGNVQEWAELDTPKLSGDRAVLKGDWWLPGPGTCRSANQAHDELYKGLEVGFRCCKDADGACGR